MTPPARIAPTAWIALGAVGAILLAVGLWMLAGTAPIKSPIAQVPAPAPGATTIREVGQAPTLKLIPTQAGVVRPPTQTRVPTQRPLPTETPVPTATPLPTDTPVPTATPFPTLAGLTVNAVDDARLVLVPAGEFVMGSDAQSDPYFWGAESPPHRVALNAFWIYETEVTNAQYLKCRAASACPRPRETSSSTRAQYYEDAAYANYPVVQVTWTMALAYCQWAGGRLPTEAEWEKAARGDNSRLFPWGDVAPTGTQANLCDRNCSNGSVSVGSIDDGYSDTAPVGSYPAGRSPYGALDMAGNVWEWVADWFKPGYAAQPLVENPIGPASGERRVMRGGSWFNGVDGLRTVARSSQRPETALYSGGFRCAQDQTK